MIDIIKVADEADLIVNGYSSSLYLNSCWLSGE